MGLAIARGIALEAVKTARYTSVKREERNTTFAGAEATGKEASLNEKQEEKQHCHLEPQEKAILELIYLKGHTCAEAAEELGVTEAALRTSLKEAFLHLKAEKSA